VEVEVDSIDPQVTGRRFGGSFTIAEWCKHRRVSISMYKLQAQGKAPATLPVGRLRQLRSKSTPLGRASARPKRILKKRPEILHLTSPSI
jgi:hypothetical protein